MTLRFTNSVKASSPQPTVGKCSGIFKVLFCKKLPFFLFNEQFIWSR
jgi:hypothetical protein